MTDPMTDTDVAIVGAGAAGLAAAKTLGELGVPFVVLEASHRIGGRAYTEAVGPGQPFDLGCHWMHSASLNPFVAVADAHGFDYDKSGFNRRMRIDGAWAGAAAEAARDAFLKRNFAAIARAAETGPDRATAEVTERENRWTPVFDYFFSVWTSLDVDRVSIVDLETYIDTDENWPVKQGFGTLVARHAAGVPVTLNARVIAIDWSGKALRLTTQKGEHRAKKIIVTVSTDILSGGHIGFDPALPDWKQEAAAALPLGNHNRICLIYDRNVFGDPPPPAATVLDDGAEPMSFSIRPFGYDYVVGMTGGRFADWLERAGIEASVDLAKEMARARRDRSLGRSCQGEPEKGVRRRHRQARGRPQRHRLARRSLGARCLFRRPARPDGPTPALGRAARRASVLRRRGDLARVLLDRPRRPPDRHRDRTAGSAGVGICPKPYLTGAVSPA